MSAERHLIWLGSGLVLVLALGYHLVGLAQAPPGLDRDAAANGWQALSWLRYGIVPFWMPHASAPEPLIVWLQTATTAWLGPSVIALRSASALFLASAAPVTYWLALEVARPLPPRQRFWAALFAGIVMACNPVVTQLARTGLRATTLPCISGLFYLFLLRAWRTGARRDFMVGGFFLGVAAYTYLAARFLPIVALLFAGLAFWLEQRQDDIGELGDGNAQSLEPQRRGRVARLHGLLLMAATAFVVVLPQLVFFLRYPLSFWERAQSVSLLQNPLYADAGIGNLILYKLYNVWRMFGVEWSGQYNQAALPLLSPLPFVGLLLSLPLFVRWRRRPAMLLMLVALVVMLLPDLIGGDRLQPHELRVIGAFVPTMALSGAGLAYGLGQILRFLDTRTAWAAGGVALAGLLAAWGVVQWFGLAAPALVKSEYAWFARPDVAIAQAITTNDAPMLVPLNDYSRSVIAYLSAARIARLQSGIDANGEVTQPSSERVLLLWPHDPHRTRVESTSYRFDPASLVLIDGNRAYLMPLAGADVAQLQRECASQPFTTGTGEVAGTLCELGFGDFDFPSQLPAPLWPVDDLYDGRLRLQGISADQSALTGGDSLGIASYWQAEQRTDRRWRYFVHILDDRQQLVAGDDLIPGYGVYATQLWQPGEVAPIRQVVQLPDDLPPGRYWIEVGLYDPLSGERALVSSSSANRTLAGPLKVPLQADTELSDAIAVDATFGDEIALEGYRLERSEQGLQATLRLVALRRPQRDYTIFLHVEQAPGEIIAQSDAQPRDGQYPTSIWDAGEIVVSTWNVALPPSPAPGRYQVWMGIYYWESGERLPVQAVDAPVDAERLLLGEIELP